MAESIKKEPGRADVEEHPRGDPRQVPPPKLDETKGQATPKSDGPAETNRNPSSPWLGGG